MPCLRKASSLVREVCDWVYSGRNICSQFCVLVWAHRWVWMALVNSDIWFLGGPDAAWREGMCSSASST